MMARRLVMALAVKVGCVLLVFVEWNFTRKWDGTRDVIYVRNVKGLSLKKAEEQRRRDG